MEDKNFLKCQQIGNVVKIVMADLVITLDCLFNHSDITYFLKINKDGSMMEEDFFKSESKGPLFLASPLPK